MQKVYGGFVENLTSCIDFVYLFIYLFSKLYFNVDCTLHLRLKWAAIIWYVQVLVDYYTESHPRTVFQWLKGSVDGSSFAWFWKNTFPHFLTPPELPSLSSILDSLVAFSHSWRGCSEMDRCQILLLLLQHITKSGSNL